MTKRARSTIPTGNTVADHVAAFFLANKTEELSIDDIMVKFGCSRAVACHAVSPARSVPRGAVLERVSVYRLKRAVKK